MNRASLWLIVSQGSTAAIALVVSTIFARILGPADFGIYFVAVIVVSIVQIAIDLCVYQAILTAVPGYLEQSRRWTRWAITVAFLAALVVAGGGSMVQPRYIATWLVLAALMPFVPASMRPRGLLIRRGRLATIASVDVLSVLLGSGVGVILILSGSGILAAALSQLIIAVIRWLGLEAMCRIDGSASSGEIEVVPAETPATLTFGQYLRTISGVYQNQLAGFISRNADNLVVSALLGAAVVAQYSRAYSFMVGPLVQTQMALNGPIVRDLSRAAGEGSSARAVRRLAFYLAVLGTPPIVVVCLLGHDIVHVLLGDSWAATGTMLQLSIGLGLSALLALPARWQLIAERRTGALRVDALMQLSILAGVAVGAVLWGANGAVAFNSFFVGPVIGFVAWTLLRRPVRGMVFSVMLPTMAAMGVLTAALTLVVSTLSDDSVVTCVLGVLALLLAEGLAVLSLLWYKRAQRTNRRRRDAVVAAGQVGEGTDTSEV